MCSPLTSCSQFLVYASGRSVLVYKAGVIAKVAIEQPFDSPLATPSQVLQEPSKYNAESNANAITIVLNTCAAVHYTAAKLITTRSPSFFTSSPMLTEYNNQSVHTRDQ